MIEITRSCSPDVVLSLRRTLASVGAEKVATVEDARAIERRGRFAFVDHTEGGTMSLSFEEKLAQGIFLKVPFYTTEYVAPDVSALDHSCGFTSAWYELRGNVLFSMLEIDQEPPYWARELKQTFMLTTAPQVLEHYSTSLSCSCGCNRQAQIEEIKRIIARPAIDQGEDVSDRTRIDERFHQIQRLVGFQPPAPTDMSVMSF